MVFMILLPNKKSVSIKLPYGYSWFYAVGGSIEQSIFGDTSFGDLLKRTAKKNKAEIFKVTSGNKKIENSLKLLEKAIYNIEHGNFLKNRLSCTSGYGCEFYNTKYCSR